MARIRNIRNRNPLILIKCEGSKSAEKIYFSNFSDRKCRIKFATGNSTDVKGMLDDLINYMNKEDINKDNQDKIYLVLDTDLDDKRISDIKSIEKECNDRGITIITSSPTFEIWYLLHFRNDILSFKNSGDVKKEVKKVITGYKETMDVYNLLYDKMETAIRNAKIIEKRFKGNSDDDYSFTPHSYVYIIIEDVKNR